MSVVHVVNQGECLTSIARRYGFKDHRALYEAPENEALRAKRPDPNVLHPGDEVVIPDRKPKTLTLATGKTHRIVLSRPKRKLTLKLQDADGQALADLPYTLAVGDLKFEGRTDSDGKLEEIIPAHHTEGTLRIGRSTWRLRVGALNPLRDTDDAGSSGIQARLQNLGYDPGPIDGVFGPRTSAAVKAFQEANGLDPTGTIDENFLSALERAYGC